MKKHVNFLKYLAEWKNFRKAFLTLNYMVKPKDLI